ncbi:hypothetical protein DMT42_13675 [Streptomyces actuosus]|uniref:Uncharacterized protein n=1 Tax=Streptomyces actuosus TaxID=1885 RepID=A0A2U9P260_STRAS|nr:hypothetical protein DMT42_13675 [Streptomyces actuosus]
MGDVRCPNATCKGALRYFRDLREDEAAATRGVVSGYPGERDEKFRPSAYHRCTTPGCRRVQRKDNWQVGGNLPEGF